MITVEKLINILKEYSGDFEIVSDGCCLMAVNPYDSEDYYEIFSYN